MAPREADPLHLAPSLLHQVLNRLARRHWNHRVLVAVGQHGRGLGVGGYPARVGIAAAGNQRGHRQSLAQDHIHGHGGALGKSQHRCAF